MTTLNNGSASPVFSGVEGLKAVTRRRVHVAAPVVPYISASRIARDDSTLSANRRWAW
jgi:hypothetical protein